MKLVLRKVENAYMTCDKERTIAITPSLYGDVIKVRDNDLNRQWVMIVEILTLEKEHRIIEAAMSRSFSTNNGGIQTEYPFCIIAKEDEDPAFSYKFHASANHFEEWINEHRSKIVEVFDLRGMTFPRKIDGFKGLV